MYRYIYIHIFIHISICIFTLYYMYYTCMYTYVYIRIHIWRCLVSVCRLHLYKSPSRATWALVGQALVGRPGPFWAGPLLGPLGPCGPGPCGLPGPLRGLLGPCGPGPCGPSWARAGPLWASWAVMGRAMVGLSWAFAGQAFVGALGPCGFSCALVGRARGPPWALAGRALVAPPWALVGRALVGPPEP